MMKIYDIINHNKRQQQQQQQQQQPSIYLKINKYQEIKKIYKTYTKHFSINSVIIHIETRIFVFEKC